MAQTHTDTNVNQLVINKMTKQEYDNLSQVSNTELYLVEEQVDSVVTQNSTNPVQSGAVYEALQQSSSNIKDGTTTFTKNNETIGTTSANQSVNQTIALPNDVVMCKMLENRALASYATPITRFKYIEDHGWVDMDRSDIQYNEGTGEWTGTFVSLDITEGEYYYDMDNEAVFVADENSEMQDVTSTVVIQDDINKLYCDVDTNILYRYNGSNFITLTSNFSGSYNDLSNKPLSVETSKVKYTLSDGTTKLTLAQESGVKDIGITFTSDTVSGNIASGETLAVMMKKIKQMCEYAQYTYFGVYNTANGSVTTEIKRIKGNGFTNGIIYVAGEVGIAGCPYNSTCIIEFVLWKNWTNAVMLTARKSGSTFEQKSGYMWLNSNNEPTWGYENVGTVTYQVVSGLTYNSVVCRLIPGAVIFQFYQLRLNDGDIPDFSELFILSGISASTYSYGTITDCDTGKSNTLYFVDTNNKIYCRGGITQAHYYSGHIVININ